MVVLSMSKHARKPSQLMALASDEEVEEELDDTGAESQAAAVPKEIMVIAQEVKIVQSLACNDLTKRNRQIRKLRKWLQLRTRSSFPLTQESLLRIWKGLYYNMWMSDKPLVQEELAEQLGQLLLCFDDNVTLSVEFFGAFLHTMCHQWFGIDQWRMDKFLMLVRRMLRYMFRVLKDAGWTAASVQLFSEHMEQTVLSEDVTAMGLVMHYFDIFFEELAKVSQGKISAEQVGLFVRPFVQFIATQRDGKLIGHCRTRVFYHLLYQSALGREYSEKYNAWKDMGFPTTSIDDLERDDDAAAASAATDEEDGDDEAPNNSSHSVLDPRAGDVDVFMPELPLDGKHVIAALKEKIYKHELTTKCRNMLKKLLTLYEKYEAGEFPLGVKTMPRFEAKSEKPLLQDKLEQLENVENDLYGTDRKLKQLNKRKRRKLLRSLNFDGVDESNYEQTIEKALPKKFLQRKRAQAALMSGWVEEEIDVAEPTPKKKKTTNAAAEQKVTTKATATKGQTEQNGDIKSSNKKTNNNNNKAAAVKSKKITAANESAKSTTTQATNSHQATAKNSLITQQKPQQQQQQPQQKQQQQQEKEKTIDSPTTKKTASPWDVPLVEGEVEIFISSRKQQVKKANADLVRNPLAAAASVKKLLPPATSSSTPNSPKTPKSKMPPPHVTPASCTPGGSKRVKIALKNNTAQNPSEYLRQVKNSPDVPYDAQRKPGKGLLKPNSMPSPINPFYKQKIGLRLLNDTL